MTCYTVKQFRERDQAIQDEIDAETEAARQEADVFSFGRTTEFTDTRLEFEMIEGMELKALVGEHVLDAVDFSNEQVKTWGEYFEDANVMRFRLDGNVYIATEDPSDGYRSSLKDLVVTDCAMKNTFPPVRVIGRHKTQGEYGVEDDVLEFIDCVTGKVVLEVGTENVDDYYPGFVASFHPEAMAINLESGISSKS